MEQDIGNEMQQVVINFHQVNILHDGIPVLSDVNIHVRKGEFWYIIGKTGSGKSSLLKTIYGAFPLQKGQAEVTGFNLSTLHFNDVPLLRRKLGMVFQDFLLLEDRSIYKNLDFALKATGWKKKNERKIRIEEVLSTVGLVGKMNVIPPKLSGGERQRAAIARALLNHPHLIIADEPTGNLDPNTSDEIMYLFHRLNRESKTTFLVASHDYRIIEKFPGRLLLCKNGLVTEIETFQ